MISAGGVFPPRSRINPVAVGVIGGTVEFSGDDVVGDYVVEAGVVIEPLIVVVRNGAGPTVEIAVVVDEVVVAGEVSQLMAPTPSRRCC